MSARIEPLVRSPNGSFIMTKLPRAIKIWTQDGVCRRTIERHCSVQSITWMPHGEGELVKVRSGDTIYELNSMASVLVC